MSSVPSCCAGDPTLHGGCIYQARLLELKLTSREHREIGNATDVVLCCQAREPFGVDFHDDRSPSKLSCSLCHVRRRHTARSAQEAQKSVRTGTLLSRMISWNCSSLTSMGSPIAGSSALQAPHFPTSERCLAGMRLDLPQVAQFRISGMDLF